MNEGKELHKQQTEQNKLVRCYIMKSGELLTEDQYNNVAVSDVINSYRA